MFIQFASLHDISSVPVTCRNKLGRAWDVLNNNNDTNEGEWTKYSPDSHLKTGISVPLDILELEISVV